MIAGVEIARGLQWFDDTVQGFWRSFFAAVVALPFYVAIIAAAPVDQPVTVTPAAYVLTQAIAYVCGWTAFPLVMSHVARFIGRDGHYVRYIVAANWCSIIPLGIFGILALLGASGTIPGGVVDFLYFGVLLWTLSFHWFVARTALQINGIGATGIVALDILLGLMISGIADTITTQAL